LRNTFTRLQRFVAIWRLSGSYQLAMLAARNRCQEVVLDFLRSGGGLTPGAAVYRSQRLPRTLFEGAALAGVGYMKQVVDSGATVSSESGGRYVASLSNGLKFEADGSAFIDTLCMLAERFVDEEYGWLEVAGHVVVDVGANIADSVIYFVRRGAVYVYGYEPNPIAHGAAVRNLELNAIKNAGVVQAAVGSASRGTGEIAFAEVLALASSEHPNLPVVCKIDCEGCEYELLAPGSLEARWLEPVTQIMIEYHLRSPDPLVRALEGFGFLVETSSGAPGVGWIRARRPASEGRAL